MPYDLKKEYFDWISKIVGNVYDNRFYFKLLKLLNRIQFESNSVSDENRAKDGIAFRYRFGYENGILSNDIRLYLDDHPCSILEMMAALAFRCEESIMSDDAKGDRTREWFWEMIQSLGLINMDDRFIDEEAVRHKIWIFLSKSYSKNGAGGLFTITNPNVDMRRLDIWYQMMTYLNEIDD